MVIRNSLKQIFRTPLRSFVFLVLLFFSTILLVTGITLWQVSVKGIGEFESLFATIATVQQKESSTEIIEMWSADTKSITYKRSRTYGEWVDPKVLDFEEADYLTSPRKRPYFGAYVPQYQLIPDDQTQAQELTDWLIVVEVKALSSGPANPIEVQVTRKFNGNEKMDNYKIKICDHSNQNPIVLEEGKSYIVLLNGPFGGHGFGEGNYTYEYSISSGIESTQRTEDGSKLEEESRDNAIDEVTPGFYETDRGKAWMEVAQAQEKLQNTLPIQPIDKTILLKAFYDNRAHVTEGRDISPSEYEEGKDVCLIPRRLAEYNGWKVGDTIRLPLYYANYGNAPIVNFSRGGMGFGFSLLDAEKKAYQVFDEDDYEIVGIYDVEGITDDLLEGLSPNEVVIPYNSVTNSWADNIVDNEPMRHDTTAFEIPNGQIDSFMEVWKKQGIDELEINFYDKGYTQLKEGIENRRIMAYIFLAGGGAVTLLIILFFCHLFIAKQERRTAIERSLGMTRAQCTVSLLFGLMLLVVVGTAAGGGAGIKVSQKVLEESVAEEYYNDMYTDGYLEKMEESQEAEQMLGSKGNPVEGALGAAALILISSGVISGIYMKKQLEKEPLSLLSRAED